MWVCEKRRGNCNPIGEYILAEPPNTQSDHRAVCAHAQTLETGSNCSTMRSHTKHACQLLDAVQQFVAVLDEFL